VVEIVNFISDQVLNVAKSNALKQAGVSESELNSKDESTRAKKINFLRKFIAELSAKATALTTDLAKAKKALNTARKARDDAASNVKKLEDERADLLKSIDDLEKGRTTLQQKLGNEIDKLRQKIRDLQQDFSAKAAELNRLMQILKANRDKCPEVKIPDQPSELSRPRVSLNPNQQPVFHIAVHGIPQTPYTIEQSSDLMHWQPAQQVTLDDLGDGSFTIEVPDGVSTIFYRALSTP